MPPPPLPPVFDCCPTTATHLHHHHHHTSIIIITIASSSSYHHYHRHSQATLKGACGFSAHHRRGAFGLLFGTTRIHRKGARLGEKFGTKGAFGCVKEIKGCLVGCVTAT
ncbi:hypothetical protein Tco_0107138, partial [Tanacetum coccineum]